MGWLGWNEKEALEADVNSIGLAMEGKLEMMNPKLVKRYRTNVADKWKSFAKDHNSSMRAKKNGTGKSRSTRNGKRKR